MGKLRWQYWGHLWESRGCLVLSGGRLRISSSRLGISWGRLGQVLNRFGAVLGSSEAVLGPSWVPGPMGSHLGGPNAIPQMRTRGDIRPTMVGSRKHDKDIRVRFSARAKSISCLTRMGWLWANACRGPGSRGESVGQRVDDDENDGEGHEGHGDDDDEGEEGDDDDEGDEGRRGNRLETWGGPGSRLETRQGHPGPNGSARFSLPINFTLPQQNIGAPGKLFQRIRTRSSLSLLPASPEINRRGKTRRH